MAGKLTLCGTPIGNLEDMSPRAVRTLEQADILACEDVRRTRKLLTHFAIRTREIVSYNEGNEKSQAKRLLERIAAGRSVVLVSDAGMPGLSDPGYRLVKACAEAGITVEVVPGPSAVVSALAVSGLPPGRFVFEGFLPRKPGDRRRRIAELSAEPRTLVIYESPHRVAATLTDLEEGLGQRRAVLARELTKLHEEVRRGSLEELSRSVAESPPPGEIVLVIEGAPSGSTAEEVEARELAASARRLMEEGVERRDAMARVARSTGVSKRRVFDALVETPSERPNWH